VRIAEDKIFIENQNTHFMFNNYLIVFFRVIGETQA